EASVEVGLGPAVGVQDLVDQRMQTRAVALVEADGEPREVRGILMRGGSWNSSHGVSAPCAPAELGARWGAATFCALLTDLSTGRKPVRQGGRYRVSAVSAH